MPNPEEGPILNTEPVELPFEDVSTRYMEFYRGIWAFAKELKEGENDGNT